MAVFDTNATLQDILFDISWGRYLQQQEHEDTEEQLQLGVLLVPYKSERGERE